MMMSLLVVGNILESRIIGRGSWGRDDGAEALGQCFGKTNKNQRCLQHGTTRFPRNLAHGLFVGKGLYFVKILAHYISPWAYKWAISKQKTEAFRFKFLQV